MDTPSLRGVIGELHSRGWVRHEKTHNLDQVRLRDGFAPVEFLAAYYEEREPQAKEIARVNSGPINLLELVRELGQRPRGRASAVLTKDLASQKAWAAELARQTDSSHLDLLDLFLSDPPLAAKVGTFSPSSLFEFLGSRDCSAKVLIVTGVEVILATWPDDSAAMKQFASRLELWERQPALLFILQREPTIEKCSFTRYPQYRFVVDQTHTIAFV